MSYDLAHTSYDYSALSPVLATSGQQRVGRVRERLTVAAEAMVAIGREIIVARDELPHAPQNGTWRLLGAVTQCDDDEDEEVAGLRAELAKAQDRAQQIIDILHEEQQSITRP